MKHLVQEGSVVAATASQLLAGQCSSRVCRNWVSHFVLANCKGITCLMLRCPCCCATCLSGKCSALIKVSADLSDIYMGHSTWDSFTAMTRIYKHYQLNLHQVTGSSWGHSWEG